MTQEHAEETPLTASMAFDAMAEFLEFYWNLYGKPDALGTLLSSMDRQVRVDGMPLDPAMWNDWLAAIERAKGNRSG